MNTRTLLLTLVVVVMGTLQAWDSRVFRAPAMVVCLVMAGIIVPAAAMSTRSPAVRFAAIVASALLLLVARIISPVTHNTLHLVTMIAALCMFAEWRLSNPVGSRT